MRGENRYYFGGSEISLETEAEQSRLVQRLRQYLELRNLTVLLGNGCSIPLGAPVIHRVSSLINELDTEPFRLSDEEKHARARQALDDIVHVQPNIGVEPLLALLANIRSMSQLLGSNQSIGKIGISAEACVLVEQLVKKWLYKRCSELTLISDTELDHHRELLRRILLRSTALPRAKVFTTNYDLLIERALDSLGVQYFDGFIGTVRRTLRSESYHYDLYYPGETTEGRVTRVDRVLHLYKLHGSINWRRSGGPAGDVQILHGAPEFDREYGDVMVYPSPLKLTEMNGYPYSEMFRHFSAQIHQPQSVLLTLGYKFGDTHINRLIYQALSIPSFVLIIVTPTVSEPTDPAALTEEHEIWRLLKSVQSNRILVISGAQPGPAGGYLGGAGTLQEFSTRWMPDIQELNMEKEARRETRAALGVAETPSVKS